MSQKNDVRVRFAPSPTGPLHIGGVRTALYNYIFARKHAGAFVLRIEDTDQSRYVAGAEKGILETLRWLGMNPDEGPGIGGDFGPYRQSERRDIYRTHIAILLGNGTAYYAFDTPEELEAMRAQLRSEGIHTPKYDRTMRSRMRNSFTLSEAEVQKLLEDGVPYTIRLKVDDGQTVTFNDRVRGEVSFNTTELDDKVLMKADGLPTYHFANVVDDHTMEISHVIRGEEWLSSTAHHVLLYRAFGWEGSMPEFAHLPLILKPTGKGKLSKRDGAKFGFPVFPTSWQDGEELSVGFREAGFLPAALVNFLAFLGWNPGTDEELFTMEELVEAFDLDRIIKSGARFDFEKAKWYNGQYIKQMSGGEIVHEIDRVDASNGSGLSDAERRQIAELYRERVTSLMDFSAVFARYSPNAPAGPDDPSFVEKKWSGELNGHFESLVDTLASADWSNAESLGSELKGFVKENGLKFGDVFRLLRTALIGTDQGPDLIEMMRVLGKDESIRRIGQSLPIFNEITQDNG